MKVSFLVVGAAFVLLLLLVDSLNSFAASGKEQCDYSEVKAKLRASANDARKLQELDRKGLINLNDHARRRLEHIIDRGE